MGDKPVLEIEITPAMMAAGLDAFYLFNSEDDPEVIVGEVYRAIRGSLREHAALL